MGALQRKFLKQDALAIFFDAEEITGDENSAWFDFHLPGGCPEFFVFVKLAGLGTGGTVDIVAQTDTTAAAATPTTLPQKLEGIAADGEWVMYFDNNMVDERVFRIGARPLQITGDTVLLTAYASPIRP